jgi:EAL and modified HD-GYP domain-containing signal transduction protein
MQVADSGSSIEQLQKFVARQPILDRSERTVGYELLFRTGWENAFPPTSFDRASSSVIADSLLIHGLSELTNGLRAFINVTREVLVEDYVTLLPCEQVVIELLETVKPDDEVIAACRRLAKAGYRLALDDFVYAPEYEPLLALADVVKVDFLQVRGEERRRIAATCSAHDVELLAEKVETRADFEAGLAAGYQLFQGYFFARPEIVVGRDIAPQKLGMLQILQVVNAPEPDLAAIERHICRDAALCYKLLRYVNSAMLGLKQRIESIGHAISLIGTVELRKWVSLIAMASMASDKPVAVVASALERARFCELLAVPFGLESRRADLFLLGLFSRLDAILDRPLDAILREVSLDADVHAALVDGAGVLHAPYASVVAYERGEWAALAAAAGDVEREMAVSEAYRDAITWAVEAHAMVS